MKYTESEVGGLQRYSMSIGQCGLVFWFGLSSVNKITNGFLQYRLSLERGEFMDSA